MGADERGASIGDTRGSRRWLAAVGLLSAGYYLAFWNRSLAATAGGELMLLTLETRDVLPYRDYFYQAPPGLPILTRAIGLVAGPHLIAAYAFGVALRVAAACALFDLLARVFRPRSAALGAVFALVISTVDTADTPFYYNHLATSLVVLGAWATVRGVHAASRPLVWMLAACALFAAGVTVKQTLGLAAVAAGAGLIPWLLAKQSARGALRLAAAATGGGFAVVAAAVAWMASHDLVGAFVEQTLTRGPSAKGGLWVSLTRPVALALELPSSEPLTLLAWLAAAGLLIALRGPAPRAIPPVAGLVALVSLAAVLGAQFDRAPLRYATLFAASLSLWCTLAYGIHHLFAWGRNPRSEAHAARVAVAALGVGCAWSLGMSWPLFEMMCFPGAAVLVAALDDEPPSSSPEAARALLAGAVALFVAAATARKISEPYAWGRWREPSLRESTTAPSLPQLAGFRLAPDTARFYEAMTGVIQSHTRPGDRILAYPNLTILYALARRMPATRGLNHWVDACPDYIARADAAALIRDPPRLVVRRDDPESAIAIEEALYRGGARSGARELRATLDMLLARRYVRVGTFTSRMSEPIDVWVLREPLR